MRKNYYFIALAPSLSRIEPESRLVKITAEKYVTLDDVKQLLDSQGFVVNSTRDIIRISASYGKKLLNEEPKPLVKEI